MLDATKAGLIKNWPSGAGKAPADEALQIAVFNGGLSARSKLVCPIWIGSGPEPSLVAKFPRNPEQNSKLVVEYEALTELRHWLQRGSSAAPRPFASFQVEETQVTVETAVAGRPFRAGLKEMPGASSRHEQQLGDLIQWVTRLHAASARKMSNGEAHTFLAEPFKQATRLLQLTEAEAGEINRLHTTAQALLNGKVPPAVFNHNDLGTTNVLVSLSGDFSGVIDWEVAGFGPPALDIYYALASYAHDTGGPTAYRQLFFSSGRNQASTLTLQANRYLSEYCKATDTPREWLPVLFGLCWLRHAMNEKAHLEALSADKARIKVSKSADTDEASSNFGGLLRYYLHNTDEFAMGVQGVPL